MEGNQTGVIESSDGDITEKLMASAVSESTKSHQNTLAMSFKVEKVTSRLLIFSLM